MRRWRAANAGKAFSRSDALEPSSIKSSSQFSYACARTDSTASSSQGTDVSKTGVIMLMSGCEEKVRASRRIRSRSPALAPCPSGNRAFGSPAPAPHFLPDGFDQFFWNAIRREQYLTDPALGRFAQRLLLFFQQLQFPLVLLQFQQFLLERSDMPMGLF